MIVQSAVISSFFSYHLNLFTVNMVTYQFPGFHRAVDLIYNMQL